MAEFIDRKEAVKILCQRMEFSENHGWPEEVDLMELLISRIADIPSAKVREEKVGEWVDEYEGTSPWTYRCANCGNKIYSHQYNEMEVKYCGKCGARMKGE